MASGDLKDLTRRTASDKILHDKAFSTAKNPKHDGYQRVLASMVYIWMFCSATHGNKFAGGTVKNEIVFNKKLAEELHKPNFIIDQWNYGSKKT